MSDRRTRNPVVRRASAKRAAAALAAMLALALGCAGPPAPADHFYRLEAGAPEAPLSTPRFADTLEVERFRSDALTSGLLLLYRRPDDAAEVHRYAYHHWVDSPTTMLQGTTATFLRRAGAAAVIVTPDMRVKGDFVLRGRIRRLEHIVGGGSSRIVLELELSVTAERGRLVFHETYREERSVPDSSVAAAVVGYNEALTAILERFLVDSAGS